MKHLFKLGALGMLALGMTACSSDEPIGNGQQVAESNQTQYVCIALSSPTQGTRANDPSFVDGTPDEHFVKTLDFIWYDASGVPTGAQATHISKDALNGEFVNQGTTTDNVTKIWTSVVPVALVQGQNLPAQVICLVNANQSTVSRLSSKNLSELINETNDYFWYQAADATEGGFQMSNSVYYGTNPLTGQTNQRLCATPVNKLYKTKDDAQKAIDALGTATEDKSALVDIYVERKAAKVSLTMAANAPQGYTLTNGSGTGNITLTFHPQYWFMNAVDKTNYITKRYGVSVDNMTPDFTTINTALTNAGWSTWNDTDNRRSYWGTSPSYFKDTYPMVSDEINDLDPNTEEPKPDADLGLKYYSYNEVAANAGTGFTNQAKAATGGAWNNSIIYTRETTTAISHIKDINGNPAATVASAVVVGYYTAGAVTTGSTFYVNRHRGTNGTYYANENDAINSMASLQNFIFTDNTGNNPAAMTNFSLAHPAKGVRNLLPDPNIAGRLVALQLTQAAINASNADNDGSKALYFYNGKTYEKITTANANQANAQLIGAGYLDMFSNGRAFFSVPIRHLNWDNAYYTADGYQWKDMKVGALGVVRNHAYNLTINSIKGLGTGLRSDDQPIVPPVTTLNQYVAVRLNILAWNIANTWSVDL